VMKVHVTGRDRRGAGTDVVAKRGDLFSGGLEAARVKASVPVAVKVTSRLSTRA
jgi:hypothetical protein